MLAQSIDYKALLLGYVKPLKFAKFHFKLFFLYQESGSQILCQRLTPLEDYPLYQVGIPQHHKYLCDSWDM